MKNKYIKLFLVAIITMFISIVPTYAKEVKLTNEANERDTFDFIVKRENSHANYVYLIGEYAFTSKYKIGLQDVMLAAKSINADTTNKTNKDTEFGKMTIYLFKPNYNGAERTWDKAPEKVVGSEALPEKFNVKYIDYNFVKEDEKINTDELVQEAMKKLSDTLFTESVSVNDNTVTVDVKTESLKKSIVDNMKSGVLGVLANLVKDDKVKSINFKYNDVSLNIDKNNLSQHEMAKWLKENSEKIFGKPAEDLILADLLDKEFEATVELGESDKKSYVSEDNGTPTVTYKFNFTGTKQKVNTNKLAQEVLKNLQSSIFNFNDVNIENGKATVKIIDDKLNEPIMDGMKSGVTELLQKLVSNENVESVDFVYNSNGEDIKYTLKKDFKTSDLVKWFNENCEKILGHSVDEALTVDLINKSFKVKINLKNYAEKEIDNPTEYTINFDGKLPEVNPKTIMDEEKAKINDKFFTIDDTKSNGQDITIKIKNIDTNIEDGMNSGLFKALSDAANKPGVESIDFVYDDIKYSFKKDTQLTDLVNWFKTNKKAIFNKDSNITLADLHNKEFTVKINVGRVGKLAENTNNTYKIKLLKTHNVTFHDDHDKDNQKEVVAVYDGETIPSEEVGKRNKRDTNEEKFLGWYEEIEEGKDKEEKFDFDNTKITKDMELDAHWGTKLSETEKSNLEKHSKKALETINSNSNLKVEVTAKVITITNQYTNSGYLLDIITGSGVKLALQNLLDESSNSGIESITLSFNDKNKGVISENIDGTVMHSMMAFKNKIEKLFEGSEIFEKINDKDLEDLEWNDIKPYADKIKIKVNLKDGKVFDDGNGEYTVVLQ